MKRLLAAALFAALAFASIAPASAQVYANQGMVTPSKLCSATVAATYPTGCADTAGDTQLAYDAGTTITLTQIIAAPTAGSIRIPAGQAVLTAYESATGGIAKLVQGTGSNCASNASTLYSVDVPATTVVNVTLPAIIVKATYELCFSLSAGTLTDAGVYGAYAIF